MLPNEILGRQSQHFKGRASYRGGWPWNSPSPSPKKSEFLIIITCINGNSEQNSFLLLKNVNQSTILLLLKISRTSSSLQLKVHGLNGNSYELTKVLVSDTAVYTGLNEFHM